MNEEKPRHAGTKGPYTRGKEDKLDKWIKQTLTAADSRPGDKIVHKDLPPNRGKNGPKYKGSKPFRQNFNSNKGKSFHGKLRIIPLGGLNQVGQNCMILEYGNEMIMIDLGFQFPDFDLLGIDYIIPDTAYLEDKIKNLKAIFFTHGHLDHIGAVPYLIEKLNFPPMYGTKLTMGLVQKRLEEFGLLNESRIHNITAKDTIRVGSFEVSFFGVNHSIPDSVGIVVKTPAGNIINTGDFKFDHTPSGYQEPADFQRIASLAGQDMSAIFIDSTNALKPGHTVTEKTIGESLDGIVREAKGRILIASFASQIGRVQQIIDICQKYGRTIYISGRSLSENINIAEKLGYLRVPKGSLQDAKNSKKAPDEKVLILSTGSQGESVSALTRMALENHPMVKIKKGDTIVLSSSPIPGNERSIAMVTNNLSRLGARVINNQIMDVHTSGHAQKEDIKLMMNLTKAKSVVPIHGEYFMRKASQDIAMDIGYKEEETVLVENGDVIEIEHGMAKFKGEKVSSNYIMVDGLGVGDIGTQVIADRQTLAENGVVLILIPINEKTKRIKGEVDVISRGFIYMKESEHLIKEMEVIAGNAYTNILDKNPEAKRGEVKKYIRGMVDKFIKQKIERHPLILPVIIEK
ncbi:ribonuclease J [Pseudomonadota bacterium]